jgi:hypothetical protein
MILFFLEALRKGKPMPIDVYQACDFTLPGIQSYRSSLQDGKCLEVPNFRERAVRDRYRNDHFACPREQAVRQDQEQMPGMVTYYQKIKARIFTPTFQVSVRPDQETALTD